MDVVDLSSNDRVAYDMMMQSKQLSSYFFNIEDCMFWGKISVVFHTQFSFKIGLNVYCVRAKQNDWACKDHR